MHQIKVANIKIDIVRKDIKNMHLAVYPPKGRVRIAVPLRVDEEALRFFVISKLPWIKNQQRKFSGQERETAREYISRESHYLFGQRYLLNVIENEGSNKIVLHKRKIDLYTKKSTTALQRQSIMNEWYRRELKRIIPHLLAKWEKKTGVHASEWGVKLMKTKWGSCNREAKRIWLNLELAKKPITCLEYIIVHELVHLLERRHNDLFLHYMASFMPKWKSHREELNRLPVGHAQWSY
ncbi:MAG: metal-dependent hydrolase [Deltaproteobacteria bacterium RBG_19FT_COMBO_43_11]|nr:MAG: metal-dependent hydrolase [Deltaproteobacteria bacterium RBG_16_44_11]OGP88346.1 MAG: metal-dependent hydrolase [Deltaproteobacteria bacterium RBG_19FT_COMBO_43_11]